MLLGVIGNIGGSEPLVLGSNPGGAALRGPDPLGEDAACKAAGSVRIRLGFWGMSYMVTGWFCKPTQVGSSPTFSTRM